MTSEVELLRAISARPDDDAARWVYADWLLERGDLRGELLQITLALESMSDFDPLRKTTKSRIDALLREHGDEWLGPFRAVDAAGVAATFHRGIVAGVRGSAAALAAAAQRIVAWSPLVSRVEVELDAGRDLAPLSDSPLLGGVLDLTISHYTPVRPTGWSVLAVPAVRAITLSGVAAGPNDIEALLAAPRAEKLRSLTISGCRLNKGALEPLARASFAMRKLDMPAHKQGPRLGEIVGENSAFHDLVELRIPGNEIGSAGFAALLPALRHVARLDVRGCSLTIDDLTPIFSGALPAVRQLLIGGQTLGDAIVDRLVSWDGAAALERLDLGSAGITARGAHALANAPGLAQLRALNLSGPRFDTATEAELVASPHLAMARIYAGNRLLSRSAKRGAKRARKVER